MWKLGGAGFISNAAAGRQIKNTFVLCFVLLVKWI